MDPEGGPEAGEGKGPAQVIHSDLSQDLLSRACLSEKAVSIPLLL